MEKRCEFDFDEVENYTEEKEGKLKKKYFIYWHTSKIQYYYYTYIVLIIQTAKNINILLFKNHMLDWLPL